MTPAQTNYLESLGDRISTLSEKELNKVMDKLAAMELECSFEEANAWKKPLDKAISAHPLNVQRNIYGILPHIYDVFELFKFTECHIGFSCGRLLISVNYVARKVATLDIDLNDDNSIDKRSSKLFFYSLRKNALTPDMDKRYFRSQDVAIKVEGSLAEIADKAKKALADYRLLNSDIELAVLRLFS